MHAIIRYSFFIIHFPISLMKKLLPLILIPFILTACSNTTASLSEEDQAAKYGMTVERYHEEKQAAARMGMTWEEHVKMLQYEGGMEDHSMHNH